MRVLIVEDEDMHAEILEKMLVNLGFKDINRAQNGPEALEMAGETPYHLIFSDCQMPGMNGYTLIDRLRQGFDSMYAQIPLIMLTSSRDNVSVQQAIKAGVSRYVAKPFDLLTLRQKILEAFANKTSAIYFHHKRLKKRVDDAPKSLQA